MTLPVIANVWQAVINWATPDGQIAKNVTYWENTVGGTAADLATDLSANVIADMFDSISSGAVAGTASIRPLDGVSAPTDHVLTGWHGTPESEWIPQAAAVLTLYTAAAGRENRGRLFLPFTAETSAEDGFFVTGVQSNLRTAWNTFVGAMGDDDWIMQVVSTITAHTSTTHNMDGSVTRGIPGAPSTPHATEVTRIEPRNSLGTQRRRQSRLRV